MSELILDPDYDGITHINIYSQGKTELGRDLSNFAYSPMYINNIKYASLEAYWYDLLVPDDADKKKLRTLHGYAAKKEGKLLLELYDLTESVDKESDEFKAQILWAMKKKLITYPGLLLDLKNSSDMPLAHYYVFKNSLNSYDVPSKTKSCNGYVFDGVVKSAGYEWIVNYWTMLRHIAIRKDL